MRKDKIVYRVIVPVLILSIILLYIHFFHLDNGPRVTPIAAEDIAFMSVTGMPEGEPAECSREQIESFVKAYNRARDYRDDYGTTHPLRVDIVFSDGTSLVVWGGTQGFQTIQRDGKQHNIRGWALGAWFNEANNK